MVLLAYNILKLLYMLGYEFVLEPSYELNKACRKLDHSQLHMLGAYAQALFEVLNWGWSSET